MVNVRVRLMATLPKSVLSATEGVLSPSAMFKLFPCILILLTLPKRIETEAFPAFAVTRSCLPSALTSPMASE